MCITLDGVTDNVFSLAGTEIAQNEQRQQAEQENPGFQSAEMYRSQEAGSGESDKEAGSQITQIFYQP